MSATYYWEYDTNAPVYYLPKHCQQAEATTSVCECVISLENCLGECVLGDLRDNLSKYDIVLHKLF